MKNFLKPIKINYLFFSRLTIVFFLTTLVIVVCAAKVGKPTEDDPEHEVLACNWTCTKTLANPVAPPPIAPRHYQVQDAMELYNLLSCLYLDWHVNGLGNPQPQCLYDPNANYTNIIPSCDNPITIDITADINLGDLDATIFPLELAPGIVLQGTFNLGDVPNGQSSGTRITFPYLYEAGKEPSIPASEWDNASNTCNQDLAFAFKLNDGAKFRNICLIGPKTTMGDFRWQPGFRDNCPINTAQVPSQHEGMAGGVLICGNDCEVSYCEIYGFPHAGTMVTEIVQTVGPNPTPAPCFDLATNANERGTFSFHHNYVHNCKSKGLGYGLYVGYTGEKNIQTPPCPTHPDPPDNFTFYYPDEVSDIHNNIFFDNTHDIDVSSARNSLDIHSNTFSQRSVKENIDMHDNNATICNPNPTFPTACPNDPAVYNDIGITQLIIRNNAFYNLGNCMNLSYPDVLTPTPILAQPYTYLTPVLSINNNYLNVPAYVFAAVPPGNNHLDWSTLGPCNNRDGHGKIIIRDKQHYQYFYWNDSFLEIDEGLLPNNVCETAPFSLPSETPSSIILSITDADLQAGGAPDDSPKTITQGETIWFIATGVDKLGNKFDISTHSLLHIWRFHTLENDLDDEQRTTNNYSLIPFTFNEIGINNITLMSIDLEPTATNDWSASNLSHQLITVTPPLTNDVFISVWIKDTYEGRELALSSYLHGIDDTRPPFQYPPSQSPTGFEKYIAIDGNIIWHQDISEGNLDGSPGWQHIVVPLPPPPPTSPGTPVTQFYTANLEIGLMAVTNVSAERVRGVTMYIDDVCINVPSSDNSNAILNGDFETLAPYTADPQNPFNPHADNWEETNWPVCSTQCPPCAACPPCPSPFTNACHHFVPYCDVGISLSTEEVRSGSYAYKGWVRNIPNDQYQNGIEYEAGHTYKAISQTFVIQNIHNRVADPGISYNIQPNPIFSSEYSAVKVEAQLTGTIYFELISPHGNVLFKDQFAGTNYSFKKPTEPGIYFTKLTQGKQISYRKFVVVR